jgi:diamine N-acetyltransferase
MIRQATSDDIEAITDLCSMVQNQHAQEQPDIFKTAVLGELKTEILNTMEQGKRLYFVCEENKVIVGYILVEVRRRPETPYTLKDDYLQVDQICVSPQHRHRGHAKALFDYCQRFAVENGLRRVQLDVWASNETAQEVFRKNQFEPFMFRMWKWSE